MREGIRTVIKLLKDTPEGRVMAESELSPDGKELTVNLTDEEIDERVARVGNTFFHPGGIAAMRSVVNTQTKG